MRHNVVLPGPASVFWITLWLTVLGSASARNANHQKRDAVSDNSDEYLLLYNNNPSWEATQNFNKRMFNPNRLNINRRHDDTEAAMLSNDEQVLPKIINDLKQREWKWSRTRRNKRSQWRKSDSTFTSTMAKRFGRGPLGKWSQMLPIASKRSSKSSELTEGKDGNWKCKMVPYTICFNMDHAGQVIGVRRYKPVRVSKIYKRKRNQ